MSDVDTSDTSLQEFPEREITPSTKRSRSEERSVNKDIRMSKKDNVLKSSTPLPQRLQSRMPEAMSISELIDEYGRIASRKQQGDVERRKNV